MLTKRGAAKKQDHPALGAPRQPAISTERPAHRATDIFGAICPQEGKAAGLILPWCNIEAMNLHLAVISAKVTPGRHAVLLVDQAGWHMSVKLKVPAKITIEPRRDFRRPFCLSQATIASSFSCS